MCKGMIGRKVGMTGLFGPSGEYVPVTVVLLGPCVVTQIKTEATDGYNALQIGFGDKKANRVNKPLSGHYQKAGNKMFEFLREVAVDNPDEYKIGQEIKLDMFKVGERVNVTGTTKGRGFSGVIKRHGFHGGKKTHGSHSHRVPGSIGCSAWPSKVVKGKKLPGRYGNDTMTIKNLEVVDLRPEENIMLLKGMIPGAKTGLLRINKKKF
ncbi:MAG: 50S ribosomal protein L3 [Desulfobacteraceae bacterium]|nr:MAG: 50S ribosomal protein L3 [Desulfobacteraceae bacterium]